MSDKRILRRTMKELLRAQSAADNAIFSAEITHKLLLLQCVRDAKRIMAFYPHQGEVDLREFMQECIETDKLIALPRIEHYGTMAAVCYTSDCEMQRNMHGIEEPKHKAEIDPGEIDVVIVPALALGEDLHRIGYGGGYYERFLKKTHAVKVGVGFDFQIFPHLPKHAHDVPLDLIVSEKRTIGELSCG